jgi:hypothetical protein
MIIRHGLKTALQLGIVHAEATVMAVQGWKGGLGHVSMLSTRFRRTTNQSRLFRPTLSESCRELYDTRFSILADNIQGPI